MPDPAHRNPDSAPEAAVSGGAQATGQSPAQQDLTRYWIRLDDGRTYMALVGVDLFGAPVVITSWGSVHRRCGGVRTFAFATLEDAVDHLTQVALRRAARGYQTRGTL